MMGVKYDIVQVYMMYVLPVYFCFIFQQSQQWTRFLPVWCLLCLRFLFGGHCMCLIEQLSLCVSVCSALLKS